MLIDLECKCTATHRWELVGRFAYAELAVTSAEALSLHDGCTYRVVDRRWSEDPASPWTSVYSNGQQEQ